MRATAQKINRENSNKIYLTDGSGSFFDICRMIDNGLFFNDFLVFLDSVESRDPVL
jgi:hypothetical protein